MKNCATMNMSLGCKQTMHRLHTANVAVSIIEFGDGYNVPIDFPHSRSSAWSREPLPWTGATPSLGRNALAMAPLLAALGAAAVCLEFPGWLDAGSSNTTPGSTTTSSSTRAAPGARGLAAIAELTRSSPSWPRQQLHPARCHKDLFTDTAPPGMCEADTLRQS